MLLSVEKAAIWSLLAGYLLLPSSFQVDVAMVPPLDKSSIPAVCAALFCFLKGGEVPSSRLPWGTYLFGAVFVLSPLLTSIGNSYELRTAGGSLPGFYALDALKIAAQNLITLAPFYIGGRFLSSDHGRATLLRSIIIAALFYSLPMLFEVRMSPQLHTWVYGYFPHNFGQQMRDGGFRPVVFLNHGLAVALFASMSTLAAIAAARARWSIFHAPSALIAPYLTIILVFCKTLGALIYVGILGPIIMFLPPRIWTKIAFFLLLTVCAYPFLRTAGLVPVQQVTNLVENISNNRAGSFEYRVENENMLLDRANEKPAFGWGTWGRNRVRNPQTGGDISVTDGTWIIQYGMFGWAGYLGLFGLLAAASHRAFQKLKHDPGDFVTGGLSVLLAANTVDLIPNSNLTPLSFLIAGALAGACRRNPRVATKAAQPTAARQTQLPSPAVPDPIERP